ncbi:FAD binding domain-containing protein [Bordetella genomosp. 4]|uniref:Carbon monoxide dehydrogenase n=1 Tax=Bordetella genomosp. 4 TaxID=463044 RepID=A0A261TUX4_9BORD|nr:FAD binding domain-containing protein [Bordetella genomosp. 4]OZI53061.1 carbon monoxide dehydrogenase [Bordetella genomosp. 4]
MKAAAYELERVSSVNEALSALARDEFYKAIAGGQSLGAMLNLRLAQPERLIDLHGIAELRAATVQGDELVLGSMTTHAAIEDGRVPDVTHGMLAHVAHGIAYRAVRNRGTIGGSLCHADPAADWISAMAVMGATCEVVGPQGARMVPAGQFVRSAFEPDLNPGEVLARIRVPRFSAKARWSYRKHCRKTGEFALAIVTGVVDPDRGIERLVLGALDGPVKIHSGTGLYARLADPAARAALLDAPESGLSYERRAWHGDLLASVVADLGAKQ